MKLINIFSKKISEKLEELKGLRKYEKISLIMGAVLTVSFYVYFISRPKFYRFSSTSYEFLKKWHDRTIFYHFWVLYSFDLVITALWIIIPFFILFFWTFAEHKRRQKCSSN
jgi:hypothetical protein